MSCADATCAEIAVCEPAAVPDGGSDAPASDSETASNRPPTCGEPGSRGVFCWDMAAHVDAGAHGFLSFSVAEKGSSAELSPELFQSSPRAGRAAVSASAEVGAYFGVASNVAWKHVRFSSSVYIDERTSDELALVLLAFRDIADFTHLFAVRSGLRRAWIEETWFDFLGQRRDRVVELASAIPRRKWARIAIEVALGAPRRLRVTLDGVDVVDGALGDPAPEGPRGLRASAGILTGSSVASEQGPVFVDDLVVEELP